MDKYLIYFLKEDRNNQEINECHTSIIIIKTQIKIIVS